MMTTTINVDNHPHDDKHKSPKSKEMFLLLILLSIASSTNQPRHQLHQTFQALSTNSEVEDNINSEVGDFINAEVEDNKLEVEDNKSEVEDNKSEVEDNKSEVEDNKSEVEGKSWDPPCEESNKTNIFLPPSGVLPRCKKDLSDKRPFDYTPKNQLSWTKDYPHCGGKRQSPIDIKLKELRLFQGEDLVWGLGYTQLPRKMTISNSQKTVKLKAYYQRCRRPSLSEGVLSKEFFFHEAVFHWGRNRNEGSEHKVDGKTFPLEMQLVHLKKGVRNLEEAFSSSGSVVILSYFFEMAAEDNPCLNTVIQRLEVLAKDVDRPLRLLNTFRLEELAKPFYRDYVSYNGSFSRPPCSEVVTWIVSPYTLDVSECQMKKLRMLGVANDFGGNFRECQGLNGRDVLFVTSC